MRRFVWMSVVILLAGFAVRLALYDFHGLEGDDGVSLALSRDDLSRLIPGLMALQLDVHPPLHYLALKGWTAVAGNGLLSLRLMNILMDVLAGALMVGIAWAVFSGGHTRGCAPTAATAGVLWAVSPLLIYTGYLIRMYTLLTLCVTAGAFCVVRARGGRAAWWYAGAAVCALAAMYTHIMGVIAVAAFGCAIAANELLRRMNIRDTLAGIGALALAGVLYLPFALPVWARYRSGDRLGAEYNPGNFASPFDVPGTILDVMVTHRLLDARVWGYAALGLFIAGSILLWPRCRKSIPVGANRRFAPKNNTPPLLLMGWVMLAAASGLAIVADLYKPRYLAAFAPVTLALLAGMVGLLPGRWLRGMALVGLVGLGGWGVLHDLDHSIRDDWVAATSFVQTHEQPGDLVLIIPEWGQEAFRFHYRGAAQVIGVLPQVSDDVDISAILESLTEGRERVWLVRYQPEVSDPQNRADAWFRERAATVTEVFPAGMQVKYYAFSPEMAWLPDGVRPLDARFGDVAALRAVYLPVSQGSVRDSRLHPPSSWVQVILYWQTLQPGADFVPRVRLTDASGQVYGGALERDNDLLRRMPVTTWQSDRMYRVSYDLNLNPDTPPGVYNLEVMALVNGAPLPASGADAGANWCIAGTFKVEG